MYSAIKKYIYIDFSMVYVFSEKSRFKSWLEFNHQDEFNNFLEDDYNDYIDNKSIRIFKIHDYELGNGGFNNICIVYSKKKKEWCSIIGNKRNSIIKLLLEFLNQHDIGYEKESAHESEIKYHCINDFFKNIALNNIKIDKAVKKNISKFNRKHKNKIPEFFEDEHCKIFYYNDVKVYEFNNSITNF